MEMRQQNRNNSNSLQSDSAIDFENIIFTYRRSFIAINFVLCLSRKYCVNIFAVEVFYAKKKYEKIKSAASQRPNTMFVKKKRSVAI